MGTSIEPIQSFTYLCENVPQWLTKLEELNAQCDEQYERFYKSTKEGEVKLTRKKKHDSTESLRPRDNVTVPFLQADSHKDLTPPPATVTAALAEAAQTLQPNPSTPLNSTHRTLKRKSASIVSAASGRGGYRTKPMVVVYYDSAIQEGFEEVVKDISNARSNLRKGKTTATFQARIASLSSSLEGADTMPSAKTLMPSFGRRKDDNSEKQKYKVYDEADRDLEEAQNLAEKAAHQFLRDGDCNMEMQAMRKRFRTVQELAEKELERLKEEKPPDHVEASNLIVEKGIQEILARAYPSLPTSLPPPEAIDIDSPKQLHFAASGAIEVDDASSDGSSIEIDMTAIRRVTRRAV